MGKINEKEAPVLPAQRPPRWRSKKNSTASLLSQPRRSRVAPSRLSKNNPKTPPAQLDPEHRRAAAEGQRSRRGDEAAAAKPASVPAKLMAPSVPGSTWRRVVIMRGRPPSTWPTSDETVSAAASASAASPTANRGTGDAGARKPAGVGQPGLGEPTGDHRRHAQVGGDLRGTAPLRFSAVPSRSFCSRPSRVAINDSTKTASTGIRAVRQG